MSLAKPLSISLMLLLLILMQQGFASANNLSSESLNNGPNATATKSSAQYLAQQRQNYSKAINMVRNGDWQALRQYRHRLADYPLYPYLIYADLIANLHYRRRSEITDYLTEYAGSVKASHLRSHWLDYLAKHGYWAAYDNAYRANTATYSQQCNYYLAQHRLGNHSKAINGGLTVWVCLLYTSPSPRD